MFHCERRLALRSNSSPLSLRLDSSLSRLWSRLADCDLERQRLLGGGDGERDLSVAPEAALEVDLLLPRFVASEGLSLEVRGDGCNAAGCAGGGGGGSAGPGVGVGLGGEVGEGKCWGASTSVGDCGCAGGCGGRGCARGCA